MELTQSCWFTLSLSSTRCGTDARCQLQTLGPRSPPHQPQPWLLPASTFQTLAALPDQDSFYDVTDALEQQGMEALVQRFLGTAGTDVDLRTQLTLYEVCRGEGGGGAAPKNLSHLLGHSCLLILTPHPHPSIERPSVRGWRYGRGCGRCSCRGPARAAEAVFRGGQKEPKITRRWRLSCACSRTWVRTCLLGWVSGPICQARRRRPLTGPASSSTGSASPVGSTPFSGSAPPTSPTLSPTGLRTSVNLFPTISVGPSVDSSCERSVYK